MVDTAGKPRFGHAGGYIMTSPGVISELTNCERTTAELITPRCQNHLLSTWLSVNADLKESCFASSFSPAVLLCCPALCREQDLGRLHLVSPNSHPPSEHLRVIFIQQCPPISPFTLGQRPMVSRLPLPSRNWAYHIRPKASTSAPMSRKKSMRL